MLEAKVPPRKDLEILEKKIKELEAKIEALDARIRKIKS